MDQHIIHLSEDIARHHKDQIEAVCQYNAYAPVSWQMDFWRDPAAKVYYIGITAIIIDDWEHIRLPVGVYHFTELELQHQQTKKTKDIDDDQEEKMSDKDDIKQDKNVLDMNEFQYMDENGDIQKVQITSTTANNVLQYMRMTTNTHNYSNFAGDNSTKFRNYWIADQGICEYILIYSNILHKYSNI